MPTEGRVIHDLIQANPPLDVNSTYAYYLLCRHFAETCAVAELEGSALGFLSSYKPPATPDRLFVWQVVVDPALRGHGMAGRLLETVLARPVCAGVRYIETTVSPSNRPSRRVFEHFAERRDAGWHEEVFLAAEDFGPEGHEDEILFRIGPL